MDNAETISPTPPHKGTLSRGDGASIVYCETRGSSERPGVIFLGGYRSSMAGIKAEALERHCRSYDQSYVRFDYQGHGESGGSFGTCTIGTWLGDTLAVLDQLTAGPQILVGSSMGGWLALLAALQRPTRISGMALIAPATDLTEMLVWERLDATQRAAMRRDGLLRLPSEYDPDGYVFTAELIEEGRRHLILDAPIPLTIPIRVLHGMNDAAVPWRHSLTLLDRLTSTDVRLGLIKDGDHRLSREADMRLLLGAVFELGGGS